MTQQFIEVVLVEDNPYDAMLALRALKSNNLVNNIVHLEDGALALDYFFSTGAYEGKELNSRPKVVFLDLKMPKVNGLEVLERLKSDERTKSIPIVVLTSSNEDPDIQRCAALGANSYVVKPVEFENFSKVVKDLGFYWGVLDRL
ncbi:MAG: response regulator [Chitinophagales bacterium]